MADQTKGGIAWTEQTWNPIRGCSRVSEGCRHCYAETVAHRFGRKGQPYEGLTTPDGRWNGVIRVVPEHMDDPLRWKRPRMVFVNSMSDLFHENLLDVAIDQVFAVMAQAPQHTFQVLTKRAERMRAYMTDPYRQQDVARHIHARAGDARARAIVTPHWWPLPNVWLGVSVEDQETADARIPDLLETPSNVHWVSYEPALAPVNFTPWLKLFRNDHVVDPTGMAYNRLDWIVVGGESGQNARGFNLAWARATVEQCRAEGVNVFVKQLGKMPYEGTATPYTSGPEAVNCRMYELDMDKTHGGNPVEWPEDLRVREYPTTP